ncbi:hypothetical protein AAMO2058_001601900 [Amorphochlora amoebiformis]
MDGVGMWFNQGNDSTSIELNVIHEVRMVHVVKTSQPPKLKTFRYLDQKLKSIAKAQHESMKKSKLLQQVTEFSIPIPDGYQTTEYVELDTPKFIGLWFKKRVRGHSQFDRDKSSSDEDFDEAWNKNKKKRQRLLDI